MNLLLQRRELNNVFTLATTVDTVVTTGFVIGRTTIHNSNADALDIDFSKKLFIKNDTTQCNPKLDPKCKPTLMLDDALYDMSGSDDWMAVCKRVQNAGGVLPTSKPGKHKMTGWTNKAPGDEENLDFYS